MSLQLVTMTTGDGVELDGGWYTPKAGTKSREIGILIVHGLTWNFYRGPSRWLPSLLTPAGYSCLAINMRDHDRPEPIDFETSYHDLRVGIDFLESQGCREVVLLAHGYACNKAVVYAAQSGDHRPRRYALATLGSIKAYKPEIWDRVLRDAGEMRGTALVVQGAIDKLIEPRPRADELVAGARQAKLEVVLLDGADHYFNDRHQQLANRILGWLG